VAEAVTLATSGRALARACILCLALLLAAALSSTGEAAERGKAGPKLDVEYEATPHKVVDAMLRLAKVGPDDLVIDLGCGDGRIPISAAKLGARGVGVDIDPQRIAEANANAKREGVTDRVTFLLQDALTTDVSDATVVTLYLLSASNLKLRPILTKQLKPGARIVSHAFSMGDWQADKVDTFTDSAGSTRTLYLWKTDGKIRP
jgi:SAM-dependent methyltransferase